MSAASEGLLTRRFDGEGEPLLLLNGGMMSIAAWEPVARHLRGSFQLLLCDLLGHILTPGASHADLDGNVVDVEALLDALDLERVHVLGTSFGAFVGLRLAATRPERVLSLIAATASDIATPAMLRGVRDLRRVLAEIPGGADPGQFHDLVVKDV